MWKEKLFSQVRELPVVPPCTSKICNRNTEADPTIKDNYRDYLFCSNKAASEA